MKQELLQANKSSEMGAVNARGICSDLDKSGRIA